MLTAVILRLIAVTERFFSSNLFPCSLSPSIVPGRELFSFLICLHGAAHSPLHAAAMQNTSRLSLSQFLQ